MNKTELRAKLEEKKIPNNAYSLEGGLPNECYCINNGQKWEVYYSERGTKSGLKEFATEEEACEYLYNALLRIFD